MTILVIGGTGLVGSRVVQSLVRQRHSVRATSRKARKFPAGVESAVVDLGNIGTLRAALHNVKAVFAYAEPETAQVLAEELRRADIRRLVLLSSADAADNDMSDFNSRRHREPELTIEQSELEWTFLRPVAFASNALFWKDQIRHTGIVRSPYPNARQSVIDPYDIGEAAAQVLASDHFVGEAPILTGPESLSQRRQVELIAEVIGQRVTFQEITPDDARAMLGRFIAPEFVELKLSALAKADAHPDAVTEEIPRITGRPPRSFREWALENVDFFKA